MTNLRPGQRGFSLVEVLISTGLLALFMTAVFFAFAYGSQAFYRSNNQQNAQAEVTKLYSRMRQDLRQTHFRSVSVVERSFNLPQGTRRRDAVCMSGVRDWQDPNSFDSINGLPKWDRYVLFYGTQAGLLIRSNIDPEVPDFSPAPYGPLSEVSYMSENPRNNDPERQTSYSTVSRSLESLEVSLDPGRDMVLVRCLMKQGTGAKQETVEIKFDISPQNTWPKAEA